MDTAHDTSQPTPVPGAPRPSGSPHTPPTLDTAAPADAASALRGIARTASLAEMEAIIKEAQIRLAPQLTYVRDLAVSLVPTLLSYADTMSEPELKGDLTVVTKADRAVESIVRNALDGLLADSAFLGEETAPTDPEEYRRIFEREHIWSVDPIDGTSNFANGMPIWGLSIGLLVKTPYGHVPVGGVVTMPAVGETFYHDDRAAYLRRADGSVREIANAGRPLDRRSVVLGSETFFHFFDPPRDTATRHIRITGATVANLLYTGAGRAGGTYTSAHLWDVAGSLPIVHRMGVGVWALGTDEQKLAFGPDDFRMRDGKATWALARPYLVSTLANKEAMEKVLTPRAGARG